MEKVKIGDEEIIYEIESICPISANILQIIFNETVPSVWGDIKIYTDGGFEADTLEGYDTVYRSEEQTIYLSNNGSVYKAPENIDGLSKPPESYEPIL